MTEIAWLVKFMMEQKLSNSAKNEVISRIGEVESLLSNPGYIPAIIPPRPFVNPMAQAPSTQKILNEMASEQLTAPIIRAPTPTPEKIDKETGRAMVGTGKGTFGPRKF